MFKTLLLLLLLQVLKVLLQEIDKKIKPLLFLLSILKRYSPRLCLTEWLRVCEGFLFFGHNYQAHAEMASFSAFQWRCCADECCAAVYVSSALTNLVVSSDSFFPSFFCRSCFCVFVVTLWLGWRDGGSEGGMEENQHSEGCVQ